MAGIHVYETARRIALCRHVWFAYNEIRVDGITSLDMALDTIEVGEEALQLRCPATMRLDESVAINKLASIHAFQIVSDARINFVRDGRGSSSCFEVLSLGLVEGYAEALKAPSQKARHRRFT
jgi:hypothetical protein